MDLIELIAGFYQALWPYYSKILVLKPVLKPLHLFFSTAFNIFFGITLFISITYFLITLTVIFGKNKQKTKKTKIKRAPIVSIHIPTRNELAAINCAKKCLEFDYPKNKYEIIIGDDSNNPEISKKIIEFGLKHSKQVKVLKRKTNAGYKAGNLNNMLKHSKGEYIVVFDSDFLPEKDFLKKIIEPFETQKNVAAVQARWEAQNANQNLVSVLANAIITNYHYIILPFLTRLSKTATLCGSAEAVSKKELEKLGGWQSGSLTEDIEYSFRLIKNNKKIVYLPELKCKCEVPFTVKDLSNQQMRWAYGIIMALKKHFLDALKQKNFLTNSFPLILISFGYLFTFLLLAMFVSGNLSTFFNPLYPTYENIKILLYDTLRNVLITTGLLFATITSLYLNKNSKLGLKLLVSSLSVGIIVIYKINIGIIKAVLNTPMQWFLLTKNSNKTNN